MRVVADCKGCGAEIVLKKKASNRYELSKVVGRYIEHRCLKCGTKGKYHLNSFHAEKSKWVNFVYPISIVLSILSIIYFWGYQEKTMAFEFIATPVVIFSLIAWTISESHEHKIRYFNKFMVER